MHKLAKGLKGPKDKKAKKAKKGKKSKKKDEELFKPEELEAYRKEHAGQSSESSAQNEEWRKFLSLTSGVDDVLKKTQDDLDRIRSTSFFQRVPPPSEVEKQEQEAQQKQAQEEALRKQEAVKEEPANLGIVELSESESEEEEDDDIFDTAYIDAVATGEIKLAYIPDSPTDTADGDDPFDTTIAERAILGPAVERKGKKLVPLGAAVEVLTGRVQLPTCATNSVPRRRAFKEQNLLLQSFDSNTDPNVSGAVGSNGTVASPPKTLLDDDDVPKPDSPIDLSKPLYIPPPPEPAKLAEEDEADLEFAALAAESLSKAPAPVTVALPVVANGEGAKVLENPDWKPFGESETTELKHSFDEEDFEADPFDTTFAENLLPGKAELKILEKEILENDFDFDPRAEEPPNVKLGLVNGKNVSLVAASSTIKLPSRDLLGGSNTDLTNLSETLQPSDDEIAYRDPFDTSIVDTVKQPGKAELKFLENELLADIKKPVVDFDDNDFDPRADEKPRERTLSRPDVLNIASKKQVSFDEPIDKNCLGIDQGSKIGKPLTPFYVRKNSVPGVETVKELPGQELDDPFDTSYVNSAPGKAEIKVLETELLQKTPEDIKRDITPYQKVIPPSSTVISVDLLAENQDIATKVLTPAPQTEAEYLSYSDPFDTSVVSTLAPGKAELKLLENELIEKNTSSQPRNREDLLIHSGDVIIEKPLSPQLSTDIVEEEDFDPFDTSFASNIQPGKAELRALESELM